MSEASLHTLWSLVVGWRLLVIVGVSLCPAVCSAPLSYYSIRNCKSQSVVMFLCVCGTKTCWNVAGIWKSRWIILWLCTLAEGWLSADEHRVGLDRSRKDLWALSCARTPASGKLMGHSQLWDLRVFWMSWDHVPNACVSLVDLVRKGGVWWLAGKPISCRFDASP